MNQLRLNYNKALYHEKEDIMVLDYADDSLKKDKDFTLKAEKEFDLALKYVNESDILAIINKKK